MEVYLPTKEEIAAIHEELTALRREVYQHRTALLHIGYVPAAVAMKLTGIMTYITLNKKIDAGELEKKPGEKKKVEVSMMSILSYMEKKQGKRTDYIRMQALA